LFLSPRIWLFVQFPEHHGVRRRVEEDVEDPDRRAHVNEDEEHAHDHRCDGQKLTEDGHLTERLVIVQVVRQDHHHRRGGDPNQKCELGDVEAPHHVSAQAGDGQSLGELPVPTGSTDTDDHQQGEDPGPVCLAARECLLKHDRPPLRPKPPLQVPSRSRCAGRR